MVYMPLDWTKFCRWVGNRGLVRHGVFDEGFGLHILLTAVFGKSVLQPYRLVRPARASVASLYGYANEDEQVLRELARAVAPPEWLVVLGMSAPEGSHLVRVGLEGAGLGDAVADGSTGSLRVVLGRSSFLSLLVPGGGS
jgi:hypothetical protein